MSALPHSDVLEELNSACLKAKKLDADAIKARKPTYMVLKTQVADLETQFHALHMVWKESSDALNFKLTEVGVQSRAEYLARFWQDSKVQSALSKRGHFEGHAKFLGTKVSSYCSKREELAYADFDFSAFVPTEIASNPVTSPTFGRMHRAPIPRRLPFGAVCLSVSRTRLAGWLLLCLRTLVGSGPQA